MTWVGFMKLFVERFMRECQNLLKEMNLVQMRFMGSLKAYMVNLNVKNI
jgi:hypothetical protein